MRIKDSNTTIASIRSQALGQYICVFVLFFCVGYLLNIRFLTHDLDNLLISTSAQSGINYEYSIARIFFFGISNFELPLWNPLLASGHSIFMHSSPMLYLPQWILLKLISSGNTFTIQEFSLLSVFNIGLAGTGFYYLCRTLSLTGFLSLVGACLYLFNTSSIQHFDPKFWAIPLVWTPYILALINSAARTQGSNLITLSLTIGTVIALMVTGTTIQWVFYFMLFISTYFIALFLIRGVNIKRLFQSGIIILLFSFCLSAYWILPFWLTNQETVRELFLFTFNDTAADYSISRNYILRYSLYPVAMLQLLMLPIVLFVGGEHKKIVIFLSIFLLFALVLGHEGEIYKDILIRFIPGLSGFIHHARIIMLMPLIINLIFILGLHRLDIGNVLKDRTTGLKKYLAFTYLVCFLLYLVGISFYDWKFLTIQDVLYLNMEGVSEEALSFARRSYQFLFSLHQYPNIVISILLVVSSLTLVWRYSKNSIRTYLLSSLIVIQLLGTSMYAWTTDWERVLNLKEIKEEPHLNELENYSYLYNENVEEEPLSLLRYFDGPRFHTNHYTTFKLAADFQYDYGGGVANLYIWNSLFIGVYEKAFRRLYKHEGNLIKEDKSRYGELDPELIFKLSTVNGNLFLKEILLNEAIGNLKNLRNLAQYNIGPDAWPKAWVANSFTTAKGVKDVYKKLERIEKNGDRAIVVENRPIFDGIPKFVGASLSDPLVSMGNVHLMDYGFNRATFFVEVKNNSMLFWSDSFAPGWRVWVNGKEVPVYKANLNFKAAPLISGENWVEYKYSPPGFKLGALLSIASLFIFLTIVLIVYLGNKRKHFTNKGLNSYTPN